MDVAIVYAKRAFVNTAAGDAGTCPARIAGTCKRTCRIKTSGLACRTAVRVQCTLVIVGADDTGTCPASIAGTCKRARGISAC
jgi:hypothetical protein